MDKPNYFDVTVWGAQGENCANYLSKGRPGRGRRPPRVARVGGQGGPAKRQNVEIIANTVQFLGSRDGSGGNGQRLHPQSDVPADTSDFEAPASGGGGSEDDIPF